MVESTKKGKKPQAKKDDFVNNFFGSGSSSDEEEIKAPAPKKDMAEETKVELKGDAAYKGKFEFVPSHFIGIPVQDPTIRANFDAFCQSIKDAGLPVEDWMYLKTPMLHITITMIDLNTPEKLVAAQDVLASIQDDVQSEILGADKDTEPKPLNLTMKGIHGSFSKEPTEEELKKVGIMHCAIQEDEHFEAIEKVSHTIISALLKAGVLEKKDFKNITYDKNTKMYRPDQFHMTVIRAVRNPIDARELIKDFGHSSLGTFQVKEIHIKNRALFETSDGTKKHRDLFDKNSEATFACEGKLHLTKQT